MRLCAAVCLQGNIGEGWFDNWGRGERDTDEEYFSSVKRQKFVTDTGLNDSEKATIWDENYWETVQQRHRCQM